MTGSADISPEDAALAAEYALGLLEGDAARAFADRFEREPALAAEVTAWQVQFAAMAEAEVVPVAPPPHLARRIEAVLFPDAAPAPIRQRIGLWRGLGLAGVATSVALAAILVLNPRPAPVAPLVADLAPVTGTVQFVALYDPATRLLSVRRSAGEARDGRAQEVWLIAGEAAPVSLGLIGENGQLRAVLPDALGPVLAGATLAVSDEPVGGSPTGAPTGDVLAAGGVIEI